MRLIHIHPCAAIQAKLSIEINHDTYFETIEKLHLSEVSADAIGLINVFRVVDVQTNPPEGQIFAVRYHERHRLTGTEITQVGGTCMDVVISELGLQIALNEEESRLLDHQCVHMYLDEAAVAKQYPKSHQLADMVDKREKLQRLQSNLHKQIAEIKGVIYCLKKVRVRF